MYLGETGRTGYERAKEHVGDWKSRKEDTHMHEHGEKEHGDTEGGPHFGMKILKAHRSALERQIHEAVIISNSWQREILNNKQEYNRCIIPRLAVIVGTQVKGDTDGEANTYKDSELRELEDNGKEKKRYIVERSQPPTKRRKRWHQEEKLAGKRRYQGDRPDTVKRRRTTTEIPEVVTKGSRMEKTGVNKILEMFEKLKKKVPEASSSLIEIKKKAPEAPNCHKVQENSEKKEKREAFVIGNMIEKKGPEAQKEITVLCPLPKPSPSQKQSKVSHGKLKPENKPCSDRVSHRIFPKEKTICFSKASLKPRPTNLKRGGNSNKIHSEKLQKITNFFEREGTPRKCKNPTIKIKKCPESSANGRNPPIKPNQPSFTQACCSSTEGGGEHSKTAKLISPGIKEKIKKLTQIRSPNELEQVKVRHRPQGPDKDL